MLGSGVDFVEDPLHVAGLGVEGETDGRRRGRNGPGPPQRGGGLSFSALEHPKPAYDDRVIQTVPGFDRLTVETGKLGEQPCIRGYRFSAQQLLELLAAGNSFEQIHEHFEFLEPDDVRQVLGHAAELADRDVYLPSSQPA